MTVVAQVALYRVSIEPPCPWPPSSRLKRLCLCIFVVNKAGKTHFHTHTHRSSISYSNLAEPVIDRPPRTSDTYRLLFVRLSSQKTGHILNTGNLFSFLLSSVLPFLFHLPLIALNAQVGAGWIGFWSTVGGCIFGVAMAR